MCQADDTETGIEPSEPSVPPQLDGSADAEETSGVLIEGITHALDGGRSVFVGQCPGESSVYIKFYNGELETKVRLSFEAASALRELLGSISTRGLMAHSTWVFVSETALGSDHQGQIEERSDTASPRVDPEA